MDFSARLAGLKILARYSQTGLGFSARAELRPGLNLSPCNRQFGFQRICYRSRAEISARDEIPHVIRPDDLFQSRYVTPGFKPFSYLIVSFFFASGCSFVNAQLYKPTTYWSESFSFLQEFRPPGS